MATSVNDFGKAVVAAGLMSADELKSLYDGLPSDARPKNGKAFGKLLIAHDKLTSYQANELLEGRGPELVLGDYVILAKIGAGGMGQVFKAQHRHMDRIVAIKLLPPEMTKDEAAIKRFQREVKAAAKLTHPNIVQAYDASVQRGRHYLVMEYVEGKDLSALIKTYGPFSVANALNYITQAARGLAYAHSKGVVHRDIKPANLLLDPEGTVKILDMGLARIEDANSAFAAAEEGLTQSGQVMGTVDYMAPEQAFDTRLADARADVYSLGCALYRLLTGEIVYAGDTVMQKFLAHREKPIPSLCAKRAEVPELLDAIFQKMLAKLPEDRYHPTAHLVADLETCAASTTNLAASQATNTYLKDTMPGGPRSTEFVEGMTAALGDQHLRSVPDSRSVPREETFNSSVLDRTQRGRRGQTMVMAGGQKPPWKDPRVLTAAGAAGLLILLLGIWVIVRNKEGEQVAKIKVPDKGSVEITTGQVNTGQSNKNKTAVKPAITAPQTLVSGAPTTPPSTGDYALSFEQDNVVTVTSLELDLRSPLTLEAYVTMKQESTGSMILTIPTLLSLGCGPNWNILHNNKGVTWTNQPAAVGKKTHVAAVWTGNEIQLFVDGVRQAVHRLVEPFTPETKQPFRISNRMYPLIGVLDEVRISKSARYSQDFSPKPRFVNDADTLALYHFDEGTGDVLKDSSSHNHHGKITGAKWVRADALTSTAPNTADAPEFVSLFNGRDLTGWSQIGERGWSVQNGVLVGKTAGPSGWLMSDRDYTDLELELEYRLPSAGNSGVFIRAWDDGNATGGNFHEVQLLDDSVSQHASLMTSAKCGSLFKQIERKLTPQAPAGAWNQLRIVNQGEHVQATINGLRVLDDNLPAGKRASGRIGLQLYFPSVPRNNVVQQSVEFRNVRLRDLSKNASKSVMTAPATSVESNSPPSAVSPPKVVYLDDLQETSTSFKYSTNLGKHGHDATRVIDWQGKKPAHSLFTHPGNNSSVYVTYALDDKYERFQTTIGVLTKPLSGLIFRIYGDDKLLWQSSPQRVGQVGTDVDVSVRGMRALKLEVECPGSFAFAHAVWIDPRLTPVDGMATSATTVRTTPTGTVLYLDEVRAEKWQGSGTLGRNGFDRDAKPITWSGQRVFHSLFMHPGSESTDAGKKFAQATYALGGKYAEFAATIGLITRPEAAQTFTVLGDGKQLWQSPPQSAANVGLDVVVDVRGVQELKLMVSGDKPNGADAVWISPRLMTVPSVAPGFVSLFNGTGLSGWKTHADHPGDWRVANGILIGSGENTTYLFSDRNDYADFHLRVETRIAPTASAGISCRSPFDGKSVGRPSRPRVLGYLAKINADSSQDPRKTGSLYVMEPASMVDGNVLNGSAVKAGEWFTMDVILRGNHIVIQVNGQTTTDFHDARTLFTKGHIALQVMSGSKQVEFRKIEIKEL